MKDYKLYFCALIAIIILILILHCISKDYDCKDFSTQEQSQKYLLKGDPYDLDRNHNGIACEGLK